MKRKFTKSGLSPVTLKSNPVSIRKVIIVSQKVTYFANLFLKNVRYFPKIFRK